MAIVYAIFDTQTLNGSVNNNLDGDFVSLNGQQLDVVLGAFNNAAGLPGTIDSAGDLDAYWDAVVAKSDGVATAGITVFGDIGGLRAMGSLGDDNFTLTAVRGAWIDARAGDDLIGMTGGDDTLMGGVGDDTIDSGGGEDQVYGGGGRDLVLVGGGDVNVDGGGGRDVFGFAGDVSVDIFGLTGLWSDGAGNSGTLTGVEVVFGFNADDLLTAGGDVMEAYGGVGDDTLAGSTGADLLDGGANRDLVRASLGADNLRGGADIDTISFAPLGQAGATVDLTIKGAQNTGVGGLDRIGGFENVIGSRGGDSITGDGARNVLDGGLGDDAIAGGRGDDSLIGGGGADELVGGVGADRLEGGLGKDAYVWFSLSEGRKGVDADLIAGLENGDTIDIASIDADNTVGGDQAFHIVGQHLTGEAGQLAVRYNAGDDLTSFLFDVDGDGKADMVIRATGDHRAYDHFAL